MEITDEMVAAVEGLEYDFTPGGSETVRGYVSEEMAREIFAKMLSAAPTPPKVEPIIQWASEDNTWHDCLESNLEEVTDLGFNFRTVYVIQGRYPSPLISVNLNSLMRHGNN